VLEGKGNLGGSRNSAIQVARRAEKKFWGGKVKLKNGRHASEGRWGEGGRGFLAEKTRTTWYNGGSSPGKDGNDHDFLGPP